MSRRCNILHSTQKMHSMQKHWQFLARYRTAWRGLHIENCNNTLVLQIVRFWSGTALGRGRTITIWVGCGVILSSYRSECCYTKQQGLSNFSLYAYREQLNDSHMLANKATPGDEHWQAHDVTTALDQQGFRIVHDDRG
jgi:hypothetical protein